MRSTVALTCYSHLYRPGQQAATASTRHHRHPTSELTRHFIPTAPLQLHGISCTPASWPPQQSTRHLNSETGQSDKYLFAQYKWSGITVQQLSIRICRLAVARQLCYLPGTAAGPARPAVTQSAPELGPGNTVIQCYRVQCYHVLRPPPLQAGRLTLPRPASETVPRPDRSATPTVTAE